LVQFIRPLTTIFCKAQFFIQKRA